MALQRFPTFFPPPIFNSGSLPTFGNLLIDAAGEKAACILFPAKTGNIRKIVWRTGTVTTGDTIDVRVETVDATTGDPSGTLWATNTNASQVVADANDNTIFTTTLTADAVITDIKVPIAIVFANGALPGNMNISTFTTLGLFALPYADLFTASWAKSANPPCLGLEYSNGSYDIVNSIYPVSALNSNLFSSGSTPDERGMKFTPAVNMKVAGVNFILDMDGDVDVVLYDTDGVTALATTTLDANIRTGLSAAGLFAPLTEITLSAGSTYRIVIKPAGSNVSFWDFDVPTAAAMDSFHGGQNFHYTSAKNPSGVGSWTDVTTKRPFMSLYVTEWDDGSGGGGSGSLMTHPGMTGGVRG